MIKINSTAELLNAISNFANFCVPVNNKQVREAIRILRPHVAYCGGAFVEVDGELCQYMYLG